MNQPIEFMLWNFTTKKKCETFKLSYNFDCVLVDAKPWKTN